MNGSPISSTPLDPDEQKLARAERQFEFGELPRLADAYTSNWLRSAGTITGVVAGSFVIGGTAGQLTDVERELRLQVGVLVAVTLLVFVAGLWLANDAVAGVRAGRRSDRKYLLAPEALQQASVANRRIQKARWSQLIIVIGVTLAFASAALLLFRPPTSVVRVTVCADLSMGAGSSVDIENPGSLPDEITLDDVDEITFADCS